MSGKAGEEDRRRKGEKGLEGLGAYLFSLQETSGKPIFGLGPGFGFPEIPLPDRHSGGSDLA